MTARRTTAALLWAGLALGGCGDEPAMPDTSKTVPVVPQQYQRRTLDDWVGLPTDAPPEQKVSQAFALAALETEDPIRAAPILLRLLSDQAPSVRLAAVVAAGRLAPPSARLAEVLVGFLDDADEPLRRHARAAVGALGAVAVEPLGKAAGIHGLTLVGAALEERSERLRWAALTGLARIGAPAEGLAIGVATIATTYGLDTSVGRQAMLTLARLGPRGASLSARFLDGTTETRWRDAAAAALAHAGADGVRALLPVVAADDEVGAAVAAGVIQEIALRDAMGETTAEAVRALVSALEREGPVRHNAMDALIAIGRPARDAVEARKASADADLQTILELILEGIDD